MTVGRLRAAAFGLLAAGFVLAAAGGAAGRGLSVPIHRSEAKGAPVLEEIELYGYSYALVIGIDDYTGGWPRLSNAVKDARLVAAEQTKHGFDVTLKTNLGSGALKSTLEEFYILKGEQPDARLFLWFAGHGHTENDEGFIIPADAPRPEAGAAFRIKALSLRRIGEFVRLAQAKHSLAVFDACFAGTVFDGARGLPPAAVTRATTLPVRQFLTSGDAGQTVSDDGSFRELFLRALRGEERADLNGDGYLTGSELGLYITDRVTNLTRAKQTPRYGKLRDKDWDRGDFVFALSSATPALRPSAAATQPTEVDHETVFWRSVLRANSADAYQVYLDQYPNGAFAPLAKLNMETKLKTERAKRQVVRPTAPPQVTRLAAPPTGKTVYRVAPIRYGGKVLSYLAEAIGQELAALPDAWIDLNASTAGATDTKVAGNVVRFDRTDKTNPEYYAAELGRFLLGDSVKAVSETLSEFVVEVQVTARDGGSGVTTAASAIARKTVDPKISAISEVRRELLVEATSKATKRLVLRLTGQPVPKEESASDVTLPGLLKHIITAPSASAEDEAQGGQ